ncbi:MAG: aminopeptidase [Desulfovibrio sp.]|jgi:aspartyl aminopeptidase|nr:aminopeptidase [Desulfovibrio sp.]
MPTKKDEDKRLYKPRNAWEQADAEQRARVRGLAERYLAFISACKTERETVAYVQDRLAQAGYGDDASGDRVLRPFRGKALFAIRRGAKSLAEGVNIIAVHGDAPRLDLKQRPLVEEACIAQGKTHYYGGIRKYQWLARPLAIHGTVVRQDGTVVRLCIGEEPGDPVFCIADLLPHLAKKQGSTPLNDVFEGEKLNIVMAHSPAVKEEKAQDAGTPPAEGTSEAGKDEAKDEAKDEGEGKPRIREHVVALLEERYGIVEEDLVTAEIQVVPAGPARFVGLDGALVGGYGQDDRICVFLALEALCAVENPDAPCALMLWDKEEIGSDGATGASSRFLRYCMEEVAAAWEPAVSPGRMFLESRAVSADVQAALDPDFGEVHEKNNAALLGYGPCFSKFTGSGGKYGASEADAEYFAAIRGLLNARGIPWQAAECGKVDQGGGGTVALFLAAYGMRVIDLGPAVLSMHSPFELASCVDLWWTLEAYRAFYEACR